MDGFLNLIFGYFGGVVRFGFSRIRKLYPYSWKVGEDTSILGIYFKCLLIAAEAQFSTDFLGSDNPCDQTSGGTWWELGRWDEN